MKNSPGIDDPRILSSREFDRIIGTIPSSRDRSLLLTHDAIVRSILKDRVESPEPVRVETPEPAPVFSFSEVEREIARRIVSWIADSHLGKSTVRADYARKIAETLLKEEPWKMS